jgi:hypothetical protein
MTGAQASYLKTLSEEAGDPDAYDENLTKAEEARVGIGVDSRGDR